MTSATSAECSDRRLYVLSVEGRDDSIACRGSGIETLGRFACLVLWDAAQASVATVSSLVEELFDAGCVYLAAWGEDCERVHDIADEVLVERSLARDPGFTTMTTWHANESLEDALWFFLNCTGPDDPVADDCRAGLVLTIHDAGGGAGDEARVRYALTSPEAFCAEVVD